jgi:hypothetical protein
MKLKVFPKIQANKIHQKRKAHKKYPHLLKITTIQFRLKY